MLWLLGSAAVFGGKLGAAQYTGDTGWYTLETTWSAFVWSGYYDCPETQSDAENDRSWELVMDCDDNAQTGYVYAQDEDISSMPFFNRATGKLAGIILGMTNPGASSEKTPFMNYTLANGTKFWGVEAHFRDPTQVCSSSPNYDNQEIGDRLFIRTGRGENDFYKAPLTEDEGILNSDGFAKGGCFWWMGRHYWRYMSVDMDCNDAYPIFLLYNGGKLNAWGIAMSHDDRPYLESKRWEHPDGSTLAPFFAEGEEPQCLEHQGKLTTQHVYMTSGVLDYC